MDILAFFLALTAITALLPRSAVLFRMGVGLASGGHAVRKTKTLDTYSSLAATQTGSTIIDTRGMKHVAVRLNVTAQTGGTADTNYFTFELLGCDTYDGTYSPIAFYTSGQILAVGGIQLPDGSNEYPILPRFVKGRLTETGTMTGFSGTAYLDYDLDGPGPEYQAGYRGG